MTDLDDIISDSQKEIEVRDSKAPHKFKPDYKSQRNFKIPVLILAAVVVFLQWNTISLWIFGIPEGTIQSDIINLLENSDQKVQQIVTATGEVPELLPSEMPSWLLGYKKTLAGYEINAEIDGVVVGLERRGDSVTITRR